MPEEEKTEKADTTEEVIAAVSKKAVMLKKAGLPTVVIILIVVMSFPGFWSLFDNTGAEAKVKAEVSYQLLKAQVEAVAEQVKANREEGKELRDLVTQLLMQRSGRVAMTDLRLPPAPEPTPALKPLPTNLDDMAAAAMAAE